MYMDTNVDFVKTICQDIANGGFSVNNNDGNTSIWFRLNEPLSIEVYEQLKTVGRVYGGFKPYYNCQVVLNE